MKKGVICGIYMITSPSGKIYIGQAVNIHKRWNAYDHLHCKEQIKLYNSLVKHGPKNHKFEIIEKCAIDQLDEKEIHYIKFYNTFNTLHGLNLQSGGHNGIPSEESKTKLSKSLMGNKFRKGIKHTEEDRKKISESGKLMWVEIKNSKEYNSEERRQKRIINAKIAAKAGVEKRSENPLVFSDEQKDEMSMRSKAMWARRRSLGLKNKMSKKERKRLPEWALENRRIAAEKRKGDLIYNSEENRLKRSECQKRAAKTRIENMEKRIEQERLSMIF